MNNAIKTQDAQEIAYVMRSLKDSFYSVSARNDEFVEKMAIKFSNYAKFIYFKNNDVPNGFIAFYINDESKIAFLSMIIVSNAFQGKGIGKSLMKELMDECTESKMEKVVLEVDKSNAQAIGFYEKYGFVKSDNQTESSYYYELNLGA